MSLMKGNPLLDKVTEATGSGVMTYTGVMVKSFILLALMFTSAMYSYGQGLEQSTGLLIGSGIGALVIALVTIFNPKISPYTSPFYAVLEGLLLGAISVMADVKYPGIAIEALVSTSGVFLVMLLLYSNRIIKVTEGFVKILIAAMFGILMIYLTDIVLSLFSIRMPVVNDSSPWGIAFSVGVVIVAALSLAVDFDQIEDGVKSKAPKYMEWYCAFGLMISLVWLYLEILRLLKKTKD